MQVINCSATASRISSTVSAAGSRLAELTAAGGNSIRTYGGVVFENVRFNGRAITNATADQISIGAHVGT